METFSALLFGTYILILTSINSSKSQQIRGKGQRGCSTTVHSAWAKGMLYNGVLQWYNGPASKPAPMGAGLLAGRYQCSICETHSFVQSACSPPDYPEKGYYSPALTRFQPGDTVTYSCQEAYTLVGKDMSKCKSDGDWSHPTPFCDRKAVLKNPYARLLNGHQKQSPQVTDSDRNTCFLLNKGEKIEVNLERQKVVYAVRLYLGRGFTHIEISLGNKKCGYNFAKYLEASEWVMIKCNNNTELSNSVIVQDKSDKSNISAVCEIEVYVKEEDGCENPPPQKKILNGHFEVSRSKATLICADGYKSVSNRLVCEDNEWKGQNQNLFCEEMLCDPQLNFTRPTGGDWIFLKPVKKISAGTERQLKCYADYKKTGHPDVIECQKNGTWTKTTATCIAKEKPKVNTQIIIYAVVGVVVVLIIIALLAAIIFIVKKQRDRQVVVIYKSAAEGSVLSGSDGDSSAYYETIHNTSTLPAPTPLRLPEILSDGYTLPLDGKNTMKKKPLPTDIAFGSFNKQSSLYNS